MLVTLAKTDRHALRVVLESTRSQQGRLYVLVAWQAHIQWIWPLRGPRPAKLVHPIHTLHKLATVKRTVSAMLGRLDPTVVSVLNVLQENTKLPRVTQRAAIVWPGSILPLSGLLPTSVMCAPRNRIRPKRVMSSPNAPAMLGPQVLTAPFACTATLGNTRICQEMQCVTAVNRAPFLLLWVLPQSLCARPVLQTQMPLLQVTLPRTVYVTWGSFDLRLITHPVTLTLIMWKLVCLQRIWIILMWQICPWKRVLNTATTTTNA